VVKLTSKQQAFCEEYLIDLNATQAAIRAGYTARTANNHINQIVVNSGVQAEIARLKAKRAQRTEITADNVVLELAKIGFSNIEDFAKIEGKTVKFTDFKDLTREQLAAVESIGSTEKGKITLKLHSKISALQDLGKHLGIYQKDNEQTGQTIFDILAIVGVKMDIEGTTRPLNVIEGDNGV